MPLRNVLCKVKEKYMYYIEGSIKDFEKWMNEFDNTFMGLFGNTKHYVGETFASANFPPCNIYQDETDSLVYELAIAGYTKDEVKVSYKDDYITVKLEVSENKEGEEKKVFAQKGIKHKNVETSYYVPIARYDVSHLTITMKDGLLRISIPCSEKAKPKEFEINVE